MGMGKNGGMGTPLRHALRDTSPRGAGRGKIGRENPRLAGDGQAVAPEGVIGRERPGRRGRGRRSCIF